MSRSIVLSSSVKKECAAYPFCHTPSGRPLSNRDRLVVVRTLPLFDASPGQSGQRIGPCGRFSGRRPLLEETCRYELLEDHSRSGTVVLERREFCEDLVRGEPLYRVHECVFAVLALESEPVDPRL